MTVTSVAVIPARGGSKRIPRKNIKNFCGRPMIAWSIETALKSGCFDRVIVSTDEAEIAETARSWGAEVPFLRPPELADDYTATRPVIRHAIREIEKRYGLPQFVCCIYATAPFIQGADLKKGLSLLMAEDCDFVFSAAPFPYPIQRALRLTEKGRIEMFYPDQRGARSQELEEAYHDAGQFYWGKAEAFLSEKRIFSPASIPVIIPHYRVQDIDTAEDWRRAELICELLQSDQEHEA